MNLPDPNASERKIAARRTNEQLKLLANALNALAIGVAGAAIIIPGVSSPASLLELQRVAWFLIAIGLHLAGHAVLRSLRSED